MVLQVEDFVRTNILTADILSKMINPNQLQGCCPSADPDL